MTEREHADVKDLLNKGYLKFFIRYMYDTQALMKKSDVPTVLQILNGFHRNIIFTVDMFEDKKVYFSVPLIDKNTTYIYFIKITM